MRILFPALAFGSVMLSACATTHDPADVCTAKWIEPRVERAVGYIERDTNNLVKTLSKSGKSFESGKMPGPFQMIKISSAINKLTKQLESGRGMKDLKILRRTCNDPAIMSDALTGYMQDKGVPPTMIKFITSTQTYQDLLTDTPANSAPETAT